MRPTSRFSRMAAVAVLASLLASAVPAVASAAVVPDPGVAAAASPGGGGAGERLTPAAVTPTALSVGRTHACAVVDGGVRCWGNNAHAQLGDGTRISSAIR